MIFYRKTCAEALIKNSIKNSRHPPYQTPRDSILLRSLGIAFLNGSLSLNTAGSRGRGIASAGAVTAWAVSVCRTALAIAVASRSIATGSAGSYIVIVVIVAIVAIVVGIGIGFGSRYIGSIGGTYTVLIKAEVSSLQINGGIAEHLSIL